MHFFPALQARFGAELHTKMILDRILTWSTHVGWLFRSVLIRKKAETSSSIIGQKHQRKYASKTCRHSIIWTLKVLQLSHSTALTSRARQFSKQQIVHKVSFLINPSLKIHYPIVLHSIFLPVLQVDWSTGAQNDVDQRVAVRMGSGIRYLCRTVYDWPHDLEDVPSWRSSRALVGISQCKSWPEWPVIATKKAEKSGKYWRAFKHTEQATDLATTKFADHAK